MDKLHLQCFELPPLGTNLYAVASEARQQLAVFDAPLNGFTTVENLLVRSGYTLEGLYLTHGHWDHTLDAKKFADHGTPLIGHPGDRTFYEDPSVMAAFAMPGLEMSPVKVDRWLCEGEELEILGHPVEVREVPGHSPGSVLFWFKEDGFAISGDALFRRAVGRTDFPGCSFEELASSIRNQIYSLPPETILYPGHGPSTTVAEEREENAFVLA